MFAVEAAAFGFWAEGPDVVAFVGVGGGWMVCWTVAGRGHDAGDGAVAWEHPAHATVGWGLKAEVT